MLKLLKYHSLILQKRHCTYNRNIFFTLLYQIEYQLDYAALYLFYLNPKKTQYYNTLCLKALHCTSQRCKTPHFITYFYRHSSNHITQHSVAFTALYHTAHYRIAPHHTTTQSLLCTVLNCTVSYRIYYTELHHSAVY